MIFTLQQVNNGDLTNFGYTGDTDIYYEDIFSHQNMHAVPNIRICVFSAGKHGDIGYVPILQLYPSPLIFFLISDYDISESLKSYAKKCPAHDEESFFHIKSIADWNNNYKNIIRLWSCTGSGCSGFCLKCVEWRNLRY